MVALLGLAWPLGEFMAAVLEGRRTFLTRALAPIERACYRAAGVRPDAEMTWRRYALATLAFNGVGLVAVYAVQRLPSPLPLNPPHFRTVTAHSAFTTT